MSPALGVWVLAVKHDAHYMICQSIISESQACRRGWMRTHFSQTNGESPDKVQPCLDDPFLCDRVLKHCIIPGDLADGREEQMRTVRDPVDPLQLVEGGNTLKGLVSGMQDTLFLDVLWEEELGAFNGGECALDDTPKRISGGLRPLRIWSISDGSGGG